MEMIMLTGYIFCCSQATCYPSFMDQLSTSATVTESRVEQDGKVVTSRGPGTAMEFSLVLVEQLYGKEKVNEIAGPLVSNISLFVDFFC